MIRISAFENAESFFFSKMIDKRIAAFDTLIRDKTASIIPDNYPGITAFIN
ncbi:MAG: hypothetical protein Q4C58_05865 [Eubacteriales bacterium]|nr:hypothetical protein [Eubacteriales bacterium]